MMLRGVIGPPSAKRERIEKAGSASASGRSMSIRPLSASCIAAVAVSTLAIEPIR